MVPRNRHTSLAAPLVLACMCVAACTWQPEARPVQPRRLAEGAFEVLGMLDTARYAGFARDPETAPVVGIVDLRDGSICELPAATFPVSGVITGPTGHPGPQFLWPSARYAADGRATLTFSDETCSLRDVDVPVSDAVYPLTLDDDGRQVVIFGNGKGQLSLYDPWNDKLSIIATGVSRFLQAQRPQTGGNPMGPEMLWLIENDALTLRTLDGTLVVQRGSAVTEFVQAAFATLHVAFVDGGDLYEAAAPDFKRALVSADACSPSYGGTTISYFAPCADRQLVRLNLQTGELEEFARGVQAAWKQGGFTFERGLDEAGRNTLFVTPPGGQRTEVTPTLLSDVQALDNTHIVGKDANSDFGIWSARDGFTPVLKSAGRIVGFIDARTNRLSWVAMHEVKGGRGTLAYVEQRSFQVATIARGVATNSVAIGQVFQVTEPVLMYVREAEISARKGGGSAYNGKLDARVLSGDLESNISDHVTSYAIVPDPNVAGLLYSTKGPDEQGLWFAVL